MIEAAYNKRMLSDWLVFRCASIQPQMQALAVFLALAYNGR
jgi:hypothetical protein